ncbi:MAG: DUF721 domain-containing protein [Ignavibacteria bacterium]|nr:DUF721 domain-containing protein [Ignavibacteria bacterium]
MPDGFKSIKDVFNNDPALKKIRAVINENDVVNDFEIIFPEFTKVAKAKNVQSKTVTLKVENAAWRSELKFKEKEIIEKINSFYGEDRITKIKFSAR